MNFLAFMVFAAFCCVTGTDPIHPPNPNPSGFYAMPALGSVHLGTSQLINPEKEQGQRLVVKIQVTVVL